MPNESQFCLSQTLCTFTSIGGQIAVVELLIKNGADVNAKNEFEFTPLHFAAEKEHENITEFLIKSGADINAKNKLSGNTALHLAKHEKIAKLLVENGADINAKSQQGFTPLHIATFGGQFTLICFLFLFTMINVMFLCA